MLLAWILAILSGGPFAAVGEVPDPRDIGNITATGAEAKVLNEIKQAHARWARITRWRIEYEAEELPLSKKSQAVHRIMAVAAPGEFYHLGAHFLLQRPREDDPYAQEYFIHEGKWCHRWPFSRAYSEGQLEARSEIPGSIWRDLLLNIVPIWPLRDYKLSLDPISGTAMIAAEAVLLPDYRPLAESASIAAEDCIILQKGGTDRIWAATRKGFCVMARETRDPESRVLLRKMVTEKVAEVAAGLWLPVQFRIQLFVPSQDTANEQPKMESRLRILRCDLNDDVPDSIFIPKHPPGSVKFGPNGQFTQVCPGGEDLLDHIAAFISKYAGQPAKQRRPGSGYLPFLTGLGAGFCLCQRRSESGGKLAV